MSKRTAYLLGILLTILIGTYFSWKYCCNKEANDTEIIHQSSSDESDSETVAVNTTPLFGFLLKDTDGTIDINVNENFNFDANGYQIKSPIASDLEAEIDKLKVYLEENPNKRINIAGWYGIDEENTSAYPNLGLARANNVENYLRAKGVRGKYMNAFGKLNEDLHIASDGICYGPISYEIITVDTDTDESGILDALANEIKEDPLILNFDTGSSQVNLTAAQREKFVKIATYLSKVDEASALVVGHTDNTGDREANIQIGQERANFAKQYLMQNGISESQIETDSKGPDQPIASNNTEEGRAQNRRTVVTIKN